jgi:hypothetical protein
MKKIAFIIAAITILSMGLAISIFLNGCNKPEHTAPILPGNEFLTTTLLVITDPTNVSPPDTLVWSEVPPATMPDTLKSFATLKQNHVYKIQIIILDSTQNPDSASFVVSNEIIQRENYHLFCFYDSTNTDPNLNRPLSSWVNVLINNPNYDANKPPLPFGITDNLTTFGPSKGQLEVVLRHQPDVKNGDCSPGSTDLDVFYNITVQ